MGKPMVVYQYMYPLLWLAEMRVYNHNSFRNSWKMSLRAIVRFSWVQKIEHLGFETKNIFGFSTPKSRSKILSIIMTAKPSPKET